MLDETLMRVVFFGAQSASEEARRHSTLVITPRSNGVGLLEFHQLDRACESGRQAAREAIESLPQDLF
jgi:NTE family protein